MPRLIFVDAEGKVHHSRSMTSMMAKLDTLELVTEGEVMTIRDFDTGEIVTEIKKEGKWFRRVSDHWVSFEDRVYTKERTRSRGAW